MTNGFARVNTNTPAAKARTRKYNSRAHREAGKHWTLQVAAGHAHCWRCGRPIPAGTKRGIGGWIVGHDDHDINLIRGAEHWQCNHTAAARKGAQVANAKRNKQPRTGVRRPPKPLPQANRDWG